ncbi:predicted protein [Verticillium alfalfae VaMs.102]|uniref:Predicted protein n=1 Tax=Verticillium alfalfae (strain VaMs.102 / ATCC MYA-4576 / FGSC 10136) TaxID=526221 RepID=C9S8Q1_VERA1|nr:predicted protein [Verticillium alfalfae VaMs.102]EEY14943.1 predicted protein [Verticillium alfalfae VaMs.102]
MGEGARKSIALLDISRLLAFLDLAIKPKEIKGGRCLTDQWAQPSFPLIPPYLYLQKKYHAPRRNFAPHKAPVLSHHSVSQPDSSFNNSRNSNTGSGTQGRYTDPLLCLNQEVGQNTWRSRRRLADAFQLAGGGRDYQRCQDSQWLTGKPEKTSETGDPLTRDSPPARATWAYP